MKSIVLCFIIALNLIHFAYPQTEQDECGTKTSTICKLTNGTRACCPIRDGTCCESGDFCCPRGFQCDLAKSRCTKDQYFIPFYLKLKAVSQDVPEKIDGDVLCPDNETTCKEKQTCCLMGQDEYGCCILDDAVCCTDNAHCCPKNYM